MPLPGGANAATMVDHGREEEKRTLFTKSLTKSGISETSPIEEGSSLSKNDIDRACERRRMMLRQSSVSSAHSDPAQPAIKPHKSNTASSPCCIAPAMTATDSFSGVSGSSIDPGGNAEEVEGGPYKILLRASTSVSSASSQQEISEHAHSRNAKRQLSRFPSIMDQAGFRSEDSNNSLLETDTYFDEQKPPANMNMRTSSPFLCGGTFSAFTRHPEADNQLPRGYDPPARHNEDDAGDTHADLCVAGCAEDYKEEMGLDEVDDDAIIRISNPAYEASIRYIDNRQGGITKPMMPSLARSGSSDETVKLCNSSQNSLTQHSAEIIYVDLTDDEDDMEDEKTARPTKRKGACSVGDTFSEDDNITEEKNTTGMFKGVGVCSANGAMSIPMAESDIYSMLGQQNTDGSGYDDILDIQGSSSSVSVVQSHQQDDSQPDKTFAMETQLLQQLSANSSVITGPHLESLLEIWATGTSSSNVTGPHPDRPLYITDIETDDDDNEYDASFALSPVDEDILDPPPTTQSVNNEGKVLLGHQRFGSSVADNVGGARRGRTFDLTNPDELDDGFTDAIEEDLANEFIQTFSASKTQLAASHQGSADDEDDGMSNFSDDGYESCASSGDFLACKAGVGEAECDEDCAMSTDGQTSSPLGIGEEHDSADIASLRESASTPQSQGTPPIQEFSSEPPSNATTTKPILLRVSPESSACHPTSGQPQQPTDDCSSNISASVEPRDAQPVEPISDIIILRGSQEQADDTETALRQTYQNLSTPQHSNRTNTNFEFGGQKPPFSSGVDSKAMAIPSSSFASFFRQFSCRHHDDEPKNDHSLREKETNQTHTMNSKTPTNSNGENQRSTSLCNKVEGSQKRGMSKGHVALESTSSDYDLADTSQEITVHHINYLPQLVSTESETTAASYPDEIDHNGNNSRASDLPHPNSIRPSQEVTEYVGRVLHSIFFNPTEVKGEKGVSSTSNQVHLSLLDNASCEEEEDCVTTGSANRTNKKAMTSDEERLAVDSVNITDNAIFLASPKAKVKRTKRPRETVSNSVDSVLDGIFSVPTLEDSIVETLSSDTFLSHQRTAEVEDQFLTDFTDRFFDIVFTAPAFSCRDSGTTDSTLKLTSKPCIRGTLSDDESIVDDATLNSLDFEKFRRTKETPLGSTSHAAWVIKNRRGSLPPRPGRGQRSDGEFHTSGQEADPSCTAMVPYTPQPSSTAVYHCNGELSRPTRSLFPLYPTLGHLHDDGIYEYGLNMLMLGANNRSLELIPKFFDTSLFLDSSSHQASHRPAPLLLPDGITVTVCQEAKAPKKQFLSILAEEEQSTEETPKTAATEKQIPCKSRGFMTEKSSSENTLTSPSSESLEWSFLALEKTIDASLDSFMNDLLSPIDRKEPDEESVGNESALQQLLTSEYCEDITDKIKKQKAVENSLQLQFDKTDSFSSCREDCSSTFSGSTVTTHNLKAAAALLSDCDGESIAAPTDTDSSLDGHSVSTTRKDSVDFVGGMTFGIAGLIGEEQIAKLDDPHVDLPALFAKEHFGSISEMVEEVHIMKAIELEQKKLKVDIDSQIQSQTTNSEEAEKMNGILETSLQIHRQRSTIEALQQELQQEIENVHNGIKEMKHSMEETGEMSHEESFEEEEISGWREKFTHLRIQPQDSDHEQDDVQDKYTICEHTTPVHKKPSPFFEDGRGEIEMSLDGAAPSRKVYLRQKSGEDIDGLETEISALHDFEEELRQELRSAEETFSRSRSGSSVVNEWKSSMEDAVDALSGSGSISAMKSYSEGATHSIIIRPNSGSLLKAAKRSEIKGILSTSGSVSSSNAGTPDEEKKDDSPVDTQTGKLGVRRWLSHNTAMFQVDGCCQDEFSFPVKEKKVVTFSSRNEEYYFTVDTDFEADSLSLPPPQSKQSHQPPEEEERSCASDSTASHSAPRSLFCDLPDMCDVFGELSYTLGFRSRPPASD